jgi:hypothetical protein
LGWQYHRIEQKRLPFLEKKLKEQQEQMEERSTREVLDAFLAARIEKNEKKASRYLTERAMAQKIRGDFALINDFESYEVLDVEKLEEFKYKFTVKIYEKEKLGYLVELITLVQILDQYYIDSVELAG